jgi:hypothetical protein
MSSSVLFVEAHFFIHSIRPPFFEASREIISSEEKWKDASSVLSVPRKSTYVKGIVIIKIYLLFRYVKYKSGQPN